MLTNQFRVLADLGAGATAEVKLVQDIHTNDKFACKIIKTGPKGISGQALIDVQKEVTIMSSMKHPYIINNIAVGRGPYDKQDGTTPSEVLFILMEYAPEGELFDMIANSGKFSESTARYFFMQLLSALSYIHNTVGICHRDLKPENILIDSDFNLKLADWGFSVPLVG